ncbi:MAG: helix-turn-helix transcriptional regulator [Alphaproteobacteria bacterium]
MNVLIKNIRKKIIEQHLTVRALEKKGGLKNAALHNFLSGRVKNPSLEKILSIAKALDCSLSDLIEDHQALAAQWDPSLYSNVLSLVASLLEQQNLYLTKIQIDKIIEEIYSYSLKLAPPSLDKNFANWVIEKHSSKKDL